MNVIQYDSTYYPNSEKVNPKIEEFFSSINTRSKTYVVFLKGFSVGINWGDSDTTKVEGVLNLKENTISNDMYKDVFINFVKNQCKQGWKFVFVSDNDNYSNSCYTRIIPFFMADKKIRDNSVFIHYITVSDEKAFTDSWLPIATKNDVVMNVILSPEVVNGEYEKLGVFSRNQTFLCKDLISDEVYFYFVCFGGGAILDKEFSYPFKRSCFIIFYNVTRIKNGKTERNGIFDIDKKDTPSDLPFPTVSMDTIVVKKGQIPLDLMNISKERSKEYMIKPRLKGRPRGSRNKPKPKSRKGRPRGSRNKAKPKSRKGRPRGSRNKAKPKSRKGRPRGSRNKAKPNSRKGRPRGSRNKAKSRK
jgi:hypothetical protein